jgi:hypothetical protein
MAAKKNTKKYLPRPPKAPKSAWKDIGLALTLIPLGIGLFLIIAWALDWDLTGYLDSQVWIGVLFLLISFTFSNLIQKRWILFAGFLLLTIADLLFLLWVNLYVQVAAGILGFIGISLVGFRYFQQISQRTEQTG